MVLCCRDRSLDSGYFVKCAVILSSLYFLFGKRSLNGEERSWSQVDFVKSVENDECSPRAHALTLSPSFGHLLRDVKTRRPNKIPVEAVHMCLRTMEVILNLVTADTSPLCPPSTVSLHLYTKFFDPHFR